LESGPGVDPKAAGAPKAIARLDAAWSRPSRSVSGGQPAAKLIDAEASGSPLTDVNTQPLDKAEAAGW